MPLLGATRKVLGATRKAVDTKGVPQMAGAQQVLSRLLTFARNRDGQSHALQQQALGEAAEAELREAPPAPSGRRRRSGPPPQRIIEEALSQKALHAWLQNRHQTLFPLTLNLRSLDAAGRELLVHIMVAAAEADGGIDRDEQGRILEAITATGGEEAERRLLPEALRQPRPLAHLLRQVQETHLSAYAYAASLLTLDQHSRVNQAYLEYLAARLGLPAEVTNSLNRRYRR
ncbi:Protein of unknown function [Belnapia rosea]|uniref:Uncharacterized protein n=1 Tax=Belnapia rosea TaxID=938405 RepID=A0A1G7D0Q6_9PROT|nr:Protein of unknown function [Belnapia rosea]